MLYLTLIPPPHTHTHTHAHTVPSPPLSFLTPTLLLHNIDVQNSSDKPLLVAWLGRGFGQPFTQLM